jgi:hypothetical protein
MSRRIANELAKEFSNQAQLEQAASLPCTVMIAPDDIGKAKIELGFIGAFAEALPRLCTRSRTRHACVEFVVAPLYLTLAVRTRLASPPVVRQPTCNADAATLAGRRTRLRPALLVAHQRQPRHVRMHRAAHGSAGLV